MDSLDLCNAIRMEFGGILEDKIPLNAFPAKIQDMVLALARQENYSIEYMMASLLAAVSTAIGNAVNIRIRGGWISNPALYMILVGRPGMGKTPPLDFAFRPIRKHDAKVIKQFKSDMEQYNNIVESNKGKKEDCASLPEKPILRRTIISDFTPEALMRALDDNQRGIVVYVDEIMGMFNAVNQYSKGQLIEQLLTAFSGKPLNISRCSMPIPIHIEHPLTEDLCTKYGIDSKFVGKKIYPYVDVNAINLGSNGGNQYVASVWPKGEYSGDVNKLVKVKNPYVNPYPLAEDEDRFIVYLSKEYLSDAEKAKRGYICVNIDDLFAADGKYKETFIDAQQTNTYTLFPSLNKFNFNFEGGFYGSNLQCKTGDMFIMRMAEVYLIAAEAEERLGNGAKAAEYLNVLRKRACRNEADFEANMKLTTATEDDVLDEYARELCGEFTRWALLKRHKAFETRLPKYNPRAAVNFSQKNYLRPISYTFLNQIENSAEYGTNGY